MNHPLFSIGVTTYNRRKMLKECLDSILSQTFSDFEVIIGNDYTEDKLSPEQFSIDDPRIRIINHKKNLGECNNMNYLLDQSKGKYFTWLADDDKYFPNFLESVYLSLEEFGLLPVVYTSYLAVEIFPDSKVIPIESCLLLKGSDFLHQYLSRVIKLQGCYGVFERSYLESIGGMQQLNPGFSPGSDQLLAIRCGSLRKVIYIDAPLIFYRTHSGSISLTSKDVDAYRNAQEKILKRAISSFRTGPLLTDRDLNTFLLLAWFLEDYMHVMHRSGILRFKKLIGYALLVLRYIGKVGKYRYRLVMKLGRRIILLISQMSNPSLRGILRVGIRRNHLLGIMKRLKCYLRKHM